MFNYSPLKPCINKKKWLKNALIRAAKTTAQTIISLIPASQMIQQIDWKVVIGTAALAGVVSILTSIVGIPECSVEGED